MAFRPPEYAALINPIAVNIFAMRVEAGPEYGQEFESFLQEWCGVLHEPEIGPRDWSPRTRYCTCKKHPSKCLCKKPLPRKSRR